MMLNLTALNKSVPIHNRSNLIVTDLIAFDYQNKLIEQFPVLNFSEVKLDASHYAVDNTMTFQFEVSTMEINTNTVQTLPLTPLWINFIKCLTSAEYISHLSDTVGIDLTDKKWLIEFARFRVGDWLDKHYDKQANKLITQLFYFNSYWDINWGGYLHILDPTDQTTLITIPPMINYSVVITAKNDAWHNVSKIQPAAKQCRLMMALQFYSLE